MNEESVDSRMIARAFGLKQSVIPRAQPGDPSEPPERPQSEAMPKRAWGLWVVWGIFIVEIGGVLAAQFPGVADFQKFGFYDQGSWLQLDQLLALGKVPTVDVGYSYGLLPLILGRLWFMAFGRTPWAFIAFGSLCNVVTAWGVARILDATGGLGWKRVVLACALLPYAIFPTYLSLAHPLEMMLIVLAIAELAQGRHGGALALAVLAVLTKPTMGYVLGFLVIVAMLARWKMVRWSGFFKAIGLAAVVAALGIGGEILAIGWRHGVGWQAVANTLLPLTGGRSYRAMHFGIFDAGKPFWLPGLHAEGTLDRVREAAEYYLLTPAAFWIVGTLFVWGCAAGRLALSFRRKKGDASGGGGGARTSETAVLVVLAILHAVFVFVFFAWWGSWTYYSYLLVLGLVVGIGAIREWGQIAVACLFAVLAVVGLTGWYLDVQARWQGMARMDQGWKLWAYPSYLAEAQTARDKVLDKHGLFLTNGALSMMWPDVRTPEVWFLSPGIQTDGEIAALRKELKDAGAVVICRDYDEHQEAWNWPEFAAERAEFEDKPAWKGKYFAVFEKKRP